MDSLPPPSLRLALTKDDWDNIMEIGQNFTNFKIAQVAHLHIHAHTYAHNHGLQDGGLRGGTRARMHAHTHTHTRPP